MIKLFLCCSLYRKDITLSARRKIISSWKLAIFFIYKHAEVTTTTNKGQSLRCFQKKLMNEISWKTGLEMSCLWVEITAMIFNRCIAMIHWILTENSTVLHVYAIFIIFIFYYDVFSCRQFTKKSWFERNTNFWGKFQSFYITTIYLRIYISSLNWLSNGTICPNTCIYWKHLFQMFPVYLNNFSMVPAET